MKTVLLRKLLPYLIVCLGVIYGIWPIDALPDVPVVGWIDDIGVIGTTILIALLISKNKKTNTQEKK